MRHHFRSLRHLLVSASAAFMLACQSAVPVQLPAMQLPAAPPKAAAKGTPPATKALSPEQQAGVKARLALTTVSDFSHTLVSAAGRWAPKGARKLQTFGGPVSTAWNGGIDITAAPLSCGAGDMATNGFAIRNFNPKYPTRVFIITRNGNFLDLDPTNPTNASPATTTSAYSKTSLGDTFTKTYVSLSGDGAVAFVVADSGKCYAIDVAQQAPLTTGAHPFKTLNLGSACKYTALFPDPMTTESAQNYALTTMYCLDNAGRAHEVKFDPGPFYEVLSPTAFGASSFSEVGSPVTLSTATPLSGTNKFQSPPVVLNRVLVAGDRAGYLYMYDYSAATLTKMVTNYGYPIETPVAVDCDDSLNITDMFVAAGAQLFWAKPDGTVYTGQYALVEKGANNGLIDNSTFGNFMNFTTVLNAQASSDYTAFSAVASTTSNSGTLPQAPVSALQNLDYGNFTQSEFLQGLPPTIWPFMGATGHKLYDFYAWTVTGTGSNPPSLSYPAPFSTSSTSTTQNCYPVQDGDDTTSARLLSPSAIDFDTDGSYFVADTNHCQVLFNPATTNSWKNWYPTGAMGGAQLVTPTAPYYWRSGYQPSDLGCNGNFYVLAGTLFPYPPFNDGHAAPYSQTAENWDGQDGGDASSGTTNDNTPVRAGKTRDIGNGSVPTGSAFGSVFYNPPLDVGNGSVTGSIARQTAINRVQGVAVGNLGLYIADRNAFQPNGAGELLFMPRATLPAGTYFGITNPVAGKLYVISNSVNPQGISVYKYPAGNRDVVLAPCYVGTNANKIMECDSNNSAPTVVTPTGGTLNTPTDCGADDYGNLFISDQGSNSLKMIYKFLPPQTGARQRTWGVSNPVANTMYTLVTGLSSICSVTFAANDPQVPSGCMYLGLGTSGNAPHRILRMDESRAYEAAAGPAFTGTTIPNIAPNDSTDSTVLNPVLGTASTTFLAVPWRARGDGNGTTYICDRFNNRIRKIVSTPGSSSANGYICVPYASGALGKPVYSATLTAYCNVAPSSAMSAPIVGLVQPFLRDGTTMWNNTNIVTTVAGLSSTIFTPEQAPSIDTSLGVASQLYPSTTGNWSYSTGSKHQWTLPAHLMFSSATDANYKHIRLGMTFPSDSNNYYYPTSQGTVNSPSVKAPSFYTNKSNPAGTVPSISYSYGSLNMDVIQSPPTIVYKDNADGGERYVYVNNANCLFRYDVTSPSTFIGTNGATVAFTRSIAGQTSTIYSPTGTFQFNPTSPTVDFNGNVYMMDIAYTAGTGKYAYNLNQFNGNLAPTSTTMYLQSGNVASNVTANATDNAGIFIAAGDYDLTELYTGLANGRIYRMALQ